MAHLRCLDTHYVRAYASGVMRTRKWLIRLVGCLYIFVASLNLYGWSDPAIRAELISPEAQLSRYLLMLLYAFGMCLLRKWSLYVFAFSTMLAWVLYFTVYGGAGSLAPLSFSLIGPVLIGLLYYYVWPVLLPAKDSREEESAHA